MFGICIQNPKKKKKKKKPLDGIIGLFDFFFLNNFDLAWKIC